MELGLRMCHVNPPTDNSEMFLKWEEAVITSFSVSSCATAIIFVLEVHFDILSPFPHLPLPHSGKQTQCSLTSAFEVRRRKWGEK